MQFLDCVVQIELALVILLSHFLVLYGKGAIVKIDLLVLDLDLFQLGLQLLDAFLALFLDLAESDDLTLGFLRLELDLVHLGNEGGAFLLVDFLQVLGLLELQLEVLFFVLKASDLGFEDIYLQLVLC